MKSMRAQQLRLKVKCAMEDGRTILLLFHALFVHKQRFKTPLIVVYGKMDVCNYGESASQIFATSAHVLIINNHISQVVPLSIFSVLIDTIYDVNVNMTASHTNKRMLSYTGQPTAELSESEVILYKHIAGSPLNMFYAHIKISVYI